jgi:GR25 family glycosyltransferase involved in LPS biosynthesis
MLTLNLYILHCPENCSARKPMCERLVERLREAFRVNVTMITEFDPAQLSGPNKKGLEDYDRESLRDHADLQSAVQPLHSNVLSCTLKHAHALARIASAIGQPGYHLVLEDDVLFTEGVSDALMEALRKLPTDYDMTFLGLPTPIGKEGDSHSHAQLSPSYPVLPTCESYVVNPYAAARMASSMSPVRLSANLQLTLAIRRASLRAYFSTPNIFLDGSKVGVYVSQLDPNNRLVWNEAYARLEKLATEGDPPRTQEQLREAQEFIDTLQFRAHPDILKLLGRLQTRLGNFREAQLIYEQVYTILVSERCVLNSRSQFLRDYMALHKHVQTLPTAAV